jgi:hypothetical protein
MLQFHRAVESMGIWSAVSDDGFSFVVSYGSRDGESLQGRPGYMASWRPLYQNRSAVRIPGSPFKTLADAEAACTRTLELLREPSGISGLR